MVKCLCQEKVGDLGHVCVINTGHASLSASDKDVGLVSSLSSTSSLGLSSTRREKPNEATPGALMPHL